MNTKTDVIEIKRDPYYGSADHKAALFNLAVLVPEVIAVETPNREENEGVNYRRVWLRSGAVLTVDRETAAQIAEEIDPDYDAG